MPKLTPEDRAILAQALQDGALAIVTHRYREEVPGSHEAWEDAEALCHEGYLRLDRITGDANSPVGERRYTYKLTPKGERAAKR